MRRIRRFAAAVAAALALVMAMGPALAAAEERDGLLAEIRARGVLRACHADVPPWAAKTPDSGAWTGSDVEAAKHLAQVLGVEVEHVDAAWTTLVPSLETGKCDIAMAPILATPERALRVLFADPAGILTRSVAVRADSDIASYAELDRRGRTVAVVAESEDEAFAKRFFGRARVLPMRADTLSTVLVAVAGDKADAVLADTDMLARLVAGKTVMRLAMLPGAPLDPRSYAYAVRPGEYRFLNFINVWQRFVGQEGLKARWRGTGATN